MDLPSTGLLGDPYYGGGLYDLFSIFTSFFGFFFNLVLLMIAGLMLYFFTGNNKPGANVVNNLMSFGLRLNSYLWMLVSTFLAFTGIQKVVEYIFNKILPEGDSYLYTDLEDRHLVNGLIYILVAALLLVLNYYVVRMVETKAEETKSVVVKVLTTFGLIFFSAAFAVTTYNMLTNWVDNLYDETDFIDSSLIGYFVASLLLWFVYMKKAMWIYKREGGGVEVDVVVVEE